VTVAVFETCEALRGLLRAVRGVRQAWTRQRAVRRLVARARATVASVRRRRQVPGQSRPNGLYLERVHAATDAAGPCDG
jgi:hypothetical protein